ncbi:MAG: anti-sigma factor family protein [Spirochaetota bacterium]
MMRMHVPFRKLSAYFDGIISAEEKVEIKEHLEHCKSCEKQYNDLKKMIGMVSSLKGIEIKKDDTFISEIITKVKSGSRKKNFRKIANISAVAASIAVVFGVIFLSPDSVDHMKSGTVFFAGDEKAEKGSRITERLDSIIISSTGRENTLRLLRMHDVKLKKISDSHIIAETDAATLRQLQQKLGEGQPQRNTLTQNVGSGQRTIISMDDIRFPFSLINDGLSERKVRIRVQVR